MTLLTQHADPYHWIIICLDILSSHLECDHPEVTLASQDSGFAEGSTSPYSVFSFLHARKLLHAGNQTCVCQGGQKGFCFCLASCILVTETVDSRDFRDGVYVSHAQGDM